jgi:hypothetical protein
VEPRTLSSSGASVNDGLWAGEHSCDFCGKETRGVTTWKLVYDQGNATHEIRPKAHAACLVRAAATLFGHWDALEIDE